ncbi:ABC transporter C family member 14-like isoform X1 [Impatiens glandulifera]|uniref:ABC transporter C family member 14-like isoform X1 n=1 Tax=Impatiens glandulifera TaxID=253017 RepID=UPI001FB13B8E|nr:ABC transporter C family member 14-like isoform X1 [Impatiens glandulifera]
MSSSSWLTSIECSPYGISDSPFSVTVALQWLKFIFISPCSQRVIFSAIDALFLLTIFLFTLRKLSSRFIFKTIPTSLDRPLIVESSKPQFRVTTLFSLSLGLTAFLAIYYIALSVFAFLQGTQSPWKLTEIVFWLIQAITQLTIFILIAHEKRFKAITHPIYLRVYWIVNLFLVVLLAASAITRFVVVSVDANWFIVDDVTFIAVLPISAFLFFIAIKGSSGIVAQETGINATVESNLDSHVTGYASASIVSKATWAWLNPLIKKGYISPLKIDEVPSLAPEHQAEKLAELFEMNWPKTEENCKNPVRTTLIRCFWKHVVLTGFLAVVKLTVVFVGPVLLQDFVNFASGQKTNPYEGLYLAGILLISKVIEVLTSHHFTFHSVKLGMMIRSTLITSLYRKGLKLTCSSRQDHGVGQIVNYMAVDAQQLADLMGQLHTLWQTPLQILVALCLLYYYFGASMLSVFLLTIAVLVFVMIRTRNMNASMFSLMMNRDKRLKATNELLNNMRVIKFQAWEEHFQKRIQSIREAEFGWLGKVTYTLTNNLVVLWSMPAFMAATLFAVSLWLGYTLDPGTVFTATTVIKMIQEPVRSFPQSLVSFSQALISLGRLDTFLTSTELSSSSVEREVGCEGRIAVEVKNGSFSWDDEGDDSALKGVNLEIRKGELAAIVGTVGSGKSSLLAAVLGELHTKSGKVRVCGTTGYVAQTAWIQNATIEENILFGSQMDRNRYKEVLRVCCLEKDLEIMDHGDKTEIGERGINLSGGQKQRIQLARAVYQDCDVYLLDDIFSAVDAHTGSEIFKECVRGILKEKTILLVTHQVDFLHNADRILVMRDGKIVQTGKYEELLESGMDFGALVAAYETSMELVGMTSKFEIESPSEVVPKSPHSPSIKSEIMKGENSPLERTISEKGTAKLIEDEEREVGHVHSDVYKDYCTEAYGWCGLIAVVVISLLWQGSFMGNDYWLANETKASAANFNPSLFIGVYTGIAVVSCILVMVRGFLVAFLGLKTAQKFFDQILHSIVHAPMSFFDTTPSGRILSRASSDQGSIDFIIPLFLSLALVMYFSLLSIIVVTCMNAWPITVLVIPLIWLNIRYRGYYIATSRELSRIDSITKAPVIHHFSETIAGVMTVRCFRKQKEFFSKNVERVNANLRMDFHNNAANEWFGFRMELIGACFLCIAALLMVTLPSSFIQPEYVGLALSYGLALNGVMFFAIFSTCSVEKYMVAVERIKQFIRIPSEAEWRKNNGLPSPNWPTKGNIEIKNLKVRYRPNTPLVLKGVNVKIEGGDKVGIVGRTGSGKSTLIQVFFRLVEPSSGTIVIDGVDICKLGLHDLRSRFGIIPQDPVLFEGTVRSNIDPLGLYSDTEIWKSLERCQLKEVVVAKPEKLDSPVADSGDNWSVGQRQLLCMGRVMLKHTKILFLDEATASVDSQTDGIIQKIIREDFASCTIISIAHRIPTVMDCDKVLVMDAGI